VHATLVYHCHSLARAFHVETRNAFESARASLKVRGSGRVKWVGGVTRHKLCVARRTSYVTRHMSHVTRHTSHAHLIHMHVDLTRVTQRRHFNAAAPHAAASHLAAVLAHAGETGECKDVTRRVSCFMSNTTHYKSHVTRQASHVTRQTSHVTRHKSHVTPAITIPRHPVLQRIVRNLEVRMLQHKGSKLPPQLHIA